MTSGYIENRLIDQIEVGDAAVLERVLSEKDIRTFAVLTGDINPLHVDRDYAADHMFHALIAHGMWGASLISALVGTELPGPGTVLISQRFDFRRPVRAGHRVRAEVRVLCKDEAHNRVTLGCRCLLDGGEVALDGEIEVVAPRDRYRRARGKLPALTLALKPDRFAALVERARGQGPIRMGVVHPTDAPSLRGAMEATGEGLIEPVLIGPRHAIETVAAAEGIDLSGFEIVEAGSAEEGAERAAGLAAEGAVAALMKGALHTDVLIKRVLAKRGLHGRRRLSHVFALDVPSYERLLFVSDAAINLRPDLEALADIVRNAIDLAHALGIADPKVALLSAVETVTERIESTLTAAALCKMAERGAITGGTLDGPLAMDNAVSEQAARLKGIVSPVAGHADVLIVPDLVSGNILAKDLDYLAGAEAAGVVLGAKVPIALTSRADTPGERVASAALSCLVAAAERERSGERGAVS